MKAEFWVMRVVVRNGARLIDQSTAGGLELHVGRAGAAVVTRLVSERDRLDILGKIAAGSLFVIGADVCEPVEMYEDQADAMHRALREHERTSCEHKVTATFDL